MGLRGSGRPGTDRSGRRPGNRPNIVACCGRTPDRWSQRAACDMGSRAGSRTGGLTSRGRRPQTVTGAAIPRRPWGRRSRRRGHRRGRRPVGAGERRPVLVRMVSPIGPPPAAGAWGRRPPPTPRVERGGRRRHRAGRRPCRFGGHQAGSGPARRLRPRPPGHRGGRREYRRVARLMTGRYRTRSRGPDRPRPGRQPMHSAVR